MAELIEIFNTEEPDEFLSGVELLQSFFIKSETRTEGVSEFTPLADITHLIDKQTLDLVGQAVVNGYDTDLGSMAEWNDFIEFGKDLVKQVTTSKSTPWEGASNFKSPTLTIAGIKFGDRATTELLRQRDLAKTAVIGKDENGDKAKRAERVAIYQNFQLNVEMPEWREEHEAMLYALPYDGTTFKKTFFDRRLGRNDSVLVKAPNFAVNQATTSIERLRRFSEVFDLSENEVIERQNQGIWRNISLNDETEEDGKKDTGLSQEGDTNVPDQSEDDNFSQFIEQQGYYDLDGDGYQEPYTFFVHHSTGLVMRIIPRFQPEQVLLKDEKNQRAAKLSEVFDVINPDREVVRIKPINNITKYGFIRDPQGGFLDVGYYHLLGALTASINATTNVLVDSGVLKNYAGSTGMLAKGFRKKMGDLVFKLGQFIQTNLSADDLQKGIRQIPASEPSLVLFNLMTMMVAASQELSASADLSTSLGANAPATTTLALIQEQQAFVGAIILRLYRSMSAEFKKLTDLNAKFLDPEDYKEVVDDDEANFEEDFNLLDMDITPVANPEVSSKIQRLQLAEVAIGRINEVAATGGNPRPIVQNFLETIGVTNIDDIYPEMQPQEELQDLLTRFPELIELISNQAQLEEMIAAAQQDAIEQEQAREDAKTASQLDKDAADTKLKEAQRIKTLEEAETENTKNASDQYTVGLNLERQSLENEALENANRQPQATPGTSTNIPQQ